MFDNVYWHHTNRAMMAMLLRAVQEAQVAGTIAPDDLAGHDDASLLAYLGDERMPAGTRDLVGALRQRQPYKVLLEISSRAGRVYQPARRALLGSGQAAAGGAGAGGDAGGRSGDPGRAARLS